MATIVNWTRIPDGTARRNRLMRRNWWQLWALVDDREAQLPALYEAVQRYGWGPEHELVWRDVGDGVQELVGPEMTVSDVGRLIQDPRCMEVTRLLLLRGWGTRLRKAMKDREK